MRNMLVRKGTNCKVLGETTLPYYHLRFIEDDQTLCIDGYPDMLGGSSIEIDQDYYDKGLFNCRFMDCENGPYEITLNRNEVEKLELGIIASSKARADEMRVKFVTGKE